MSVAQFPPQLASSCHIGSLVFKFYKTGLPGQNARVTVAQLGHTLFFYEHSFRHYLLRYTVHLWEAVNRVELLTIRTISGHLPGRTRVLWSSASAVRRGLRLRVKYSSNARNVHYYVTSMSHFALLQLAKVAILVEFATVLSSILHYKTTGGRL